MLTATALAFDANAVSFFAEPDPDEARDLPLGPGPAEAPCSEKWRSGCPSFQSKIADDLDNAAEAAATAASGVNAALTFLAKLVVVLFGAGVAYAWYREGRLPRFPKQSNADNEGDGQ
jgi:hypothetical protein